MQTVAIQAAGTVARPTPGFMALCCSTASGRAEERLHPIRSIEEYRRENHNYYPLHIDWYSTSIVVLL